MPISPTPFAVFLSFNSKDRAEVKRLAEYLADTAQLRPWFDEWELIPGESWIDALTRGLQESAACAVFVGNSGEGPWQEQEIRNALIHRAKNKDFRIIPVLLPTATHQPELPPFLPTLTWVDFRGKDLTNNKDALWKLECGIQGKAPGRGRPQGAHTATPAQSHVAPVPSPPKNQFAPPRKRIIDFLAALDVVKERDGRKTLIISADLEPTLAMQINVDQPPMIFAANTVATLLSYGTLHDGRHALEAVLLAAYDLGGGEHHTRCKALLQESGFRLPSGVA